MSATDVLAIVAATVVAMFVAVLAAMLVALARTLRDLRAAVTALHDDALVVLDDARDAAREAAIEVDRVERLVTAAERLGDAKRALASPVVKAMAFGSGVSRAAQRLRDGESPRGPTSKRRSAS